MFKTFSPTRIGLLTTLLLCVSGAANAAEWGSLKGRFVVDGTAPPQPALPLTDELCLKLKPPNKAVVVDAKSGLANAVIFLRLARNEKVEIHPDYAAALSTPAVLDNKGCEFHPRISLVRVGQPFLIKNSDPMGHNTKYELVNSKFNESIPAGGERKVSFQKTEANPAPVNCSIHTFMLGHLLVQDHPYMAASGEDGSFEIKNIPAGKHSFQFWHEKGNLQDMKFAGGTTDRRGRADITIAAGKTLDLGDMKVPATMLK
jgi:hypothetical protein